MIPETLCSWLVWHFPVSCIMVLGGVWRGFVPKLVPRFEPGTWKRGSLGKKMSLPITHPTRRKMSGTARSGLFLTARRGLLTSDGVIGRDSPDQVGLPIRAALVA